MPIARCIGCDQDFDTAPRRSDTKHCPECAPLRSHRNPNGGRLPVAVLRSLGNVCAICGGEVDFSVRRPDPRSPSVDHKIPKALGGTHDPSNLQMAHLWCNQAKHLRQATDTEARREKQRFYNLRAWRRLAVTVKAEEPTCRTCGNPSECASHITPLDEGGSPWDRKNIEALCRPCRNQKAQATYRRQVSTQEPGSVRMGT